MKVLVCGDIHWSTYSSILRSRGNNFSTRLEYLIRSLNWVEQVSKEHGCEEEIFLGDFFDRPDIDQESITALSEIDWCSSAKLRHFIVGNHESGVASLKYNSAQALHKVGVIEDTAYYYPLDDKTEFLFLPYITEDNRIPLEEYCLKRNKNKKLIVFSHNEIKDAQMGRFISKTGYAIKDIEDNCDLFINGHLHNGAWITKKILNLGSLCGLNFNEDATVYEHHIAILDTDTLNVELIKNPYALNFYKFEINENSELSQLSLIKENAVVSIKCEDTLKEELTNRLSNIDTVCVKVCYYAKELTDEVNNIAELQTVDHLDKFRNFIIEKLGNSEIVQVELSEVCK